MKIKHFPAFILSFGMLCAVPIPAHAETPTEQVYYDFQYLEYSDHIEITGLSSDTPETYAFRSIIVPAEIGDIPVTVIKNRAFAGEKISKIQLPEGIHTIEANAFEGCWDLENVNIPDTVTEIGNCCFQYCWSLESICIPDSVRTIGNSLFHGCLNLETVQLSSQINSLPFNTFSFTDVRNVTIPEQIDSIDYFSLGWCENLKSVTFLNPDCKITDDGSVIFNSAYDNQFQFGGIIYGYEGSTAQKYAQKYGLEFRTIGTDFVSNVAGDVSGDGKLSIIDAIQVKRCIHSRKALPQIGDMNGDNVVNVIDLALLKQALLKQK